MTTGSTDVYYDPLRRELLQRFPDWEVDMTQARLAFTSVVRGWETLPAAIG